MEPAAEAREGRGLAKGNSRERNAPRTQGRTERAQGARACTGRQQDGTEHNGSPRSCTTSTTSSVLRAAYLALKRDAAPGVDGETWEQYGEDLEATFRTSPDRLQRGAYRAKPVRRVYIPKADGRQRPLGVPALEDKIVQRAVVEVLNAIYEADFLGFSYGFRPGRSPHQALDALAVGHRDEEGELGARCGHSRLLRHVEPRMADPVSSSTGSRTGASCGSSRSG